MEINWIIIVGIVVMAIVLIVFLVWRNKQDEKKYEVYLNENEVPTEDDPDEDEYNNHS